MILDQLAAALGDRYRVARQLGEGGMAMVFLATDLKHDRQVAIKVMKPELVASVGADRFLNEIRLTARFNHPNILQLFDSGGVNGLLYYVMPYVEGESLRARLNRERQLPVDDALSIATGVASALHYAHEQGVVHRDVKPENVLLHSGQPLVADFGIALARASADATRLTAAGTSVGSPAYMSPEQASGDRELDRRTDVYSLACVLYEMLAGEPPFTSTGAQMLIARIVAEKPTPIRRLRSSVPESVAAAIDRALEKAPADRFHNARDFAAALGLRSTPSLWRARRSRVLVATGIVVVIGAAAFAVARQRMTTATTSVQNWQHTQLTFTGRAEQPAVSPDGQSIAYVERTVDKNSGAGRLMLLDVAGGDPVEVARDTLMLNGPKWRPDGASLLFFAGMSGESVQPGLYLVPRLGGERRLVVATTPYPNFEWSPDGQRLAVITKGLLRNLDLRHSQPVVDSVPVKYGGAEGFSPVWSPKSDWLAITTSNPSGTAIRVVDLKGALRDSIINARQPVWHPSGRWMYYLADRGRTLELRRVPFDVRSGRFDGEAVTILSDARSLFLSAVWDDGEKALYTQPTEVSRLFRLPLARTGTSALANGQELTPGTAYYALPSLSPDANWLSYKKLTPDGGDLFVRPVLGGAERRLTTNGKLVRDATWSPDGSRLAFGMSTDSGSVPMIVLAAGGAARRVGTRRASHRGVSRQFAWSPDGRRLLHQLEGNKNFVIVDIASNEERLLLSGPQQYMFATRAIFSPDGQRVAMHAGVMKGAAGVWIVDLAGGAPRLLTSDLGVPVSWTGNTILYDFEGTIRSISAKGGASRPYATMPKDCGDVAFNIRQDWIVCARGETLQDIWLLDHFDRR